jgi:lysophospholipase L1-like esterase
MPPIKEFPAFTSTIKFVIGNLVEIFGKRLHRRVYKKENVYYNNEIISLNTWKKRFNLEGNINTFFSDGVHPSKLTYQVWGKDMAQFIINSKSFKIWMQKK